MKYLKLIPAIIIFLIALPFIIYACIKIDFETEP